MRFALLGTHPDGLEMACALAATGRHELAAYTALPSDTAFISRYGSRARPITDLEEVLADPAIEAVIVAGTSANRPAQLRRSLLSERHVLCVYPPDQTPDAAYEAAMIQADTGRVLFPILPDGLHPAIQRLGKIAHAPDVSLGELKLLQVEHAVTGEFLLEPGEIYVKCALPGWDRLRAIAGEIAVVSAIAPQEDLEPGQTLLLSGVFANGGLFEVTFLAESPQPCWRANLVGTRGRMELLFPNGWQGPSFLTWQAEHGEWHEEYFADWDPWPTLVGAFEAASRKDAKTQNPPDERISPSLATASSLGASAPLRDPLSPSWQDVIRAQELDTAARRSVSRRRADTLEFPDATEEATFKGTMTLVGCGLIWIILLLLVLSAWKPWLGWFIVPVLTVFILLQGLRWFARRTND
jgi:predicted dehydrogenase